jgi:hypothetical protein
MAGLGFLLKGSLLVGQLPCLRCVWRLRVSPDKILQRGRLARGLCGFPRLVHLRILFRGTLLPAAFLRGDHGFQSLRWFLSIRWFSRGERWCRDLRLGFGLTAKVLLGFQSLG